MLRELANTEPAWEIAELFPPQGHWTIDDYLALDGKNNHLVEFSQGTVEVLPMPSIHQQRIARTLFHLLYMFVTTHNLGEVFFAPTRVQLWENKIREPDVFFVAHANLAYRTEQWFEKVDLAIEIISPDDPNRDLKTKRREYAQAGIAEYWIVDPRSDEVLILALADKRYKVHGVFSKGETASSIHLDGFSVQVNELFD